MSRKSQEPTVFAPKTSKTGLIISIIGVTLLVVLGVSLTKHWLDNHVNHAVGYSYVGTDGTVKIYACKTYYDVYGGVYKVNALFFKDATAAGAKYYLTSMRNNQPVSGQEKSGSSYDKGIVGSLVTNASAYNRDPFLVKVGDSWSSGQHVTNRITDCPIPLSN